MESVCIRCKHEMGRLSIAVVLTILLCIPSVAAPDKIEHYVSTEFSPDQIAVYSFILKSYRTLLKPTYRDMLAKNFYLEGETGPLDVGELKRGRGCLKGIDLETVPREKIPTVHRLIEQKWLPSYVKSARGVKCIDSQLSKSNICWQTEGALSITEIGFYKRHRHALVGFDVHCGMQCGWGQILLLEKVNGHWHRKGVCLEVYI